MSSPLSRENFQDQLLSPPKIVQEDASREYEFTARFTPLGGSEVDFDSGTGPKEVFTEPPVEIKSPVEILSLPRHTFDDGGTPVESLARSWMFKSDTLPPILGTADHHELYYFLIQQDRKNSSPDDILVNIDAHDDVYQLDGLENAGNSVGLENFVSQGMRPDFRQTWGHYNWIATDKAHGAGVKKNLFDRTTRFTKEQITQGLDDAVRQAKEKGSKVIVTIDLDFFGAEQQPFDPEKSAPQLQEIFKFIKSNSDFIRLVHFTESLVYATKGNQQIQQLYEQIIPLIETGHTTTTQHSSDLAVLRQRS
jgi:hypothetical protein